MLEAILGNELFTLCALAYKTFSASPPLSLSLFFQDVPAPGPPRTKMTVILLASKTGVSEKLTAGASASEASGTFLLVPVSVSVSVSRLTGVGVVWVWVWVAAACLS